MLLPQLLTPQPKLQQFMARLYFERKSQLLRSHPFLDRMTPDKRIRASALMASTGHKTAYSWLLALPNSGLGQSMNPVEFRVAISLRLLIPLFPSEFHCCASGCTSGVFDEFGYHALICGGTGNLRKSRHDVVRDALYDLGIRAGFNPVKDASVHCLGLTSSHTLRPADLLVRGDDYDRDCIDVTVVSPLRKTMSAGFTPGLAASTAERGKYVKHEAACNLANYGFKAFAADVFGVLGPRSEQFLDRLCNAFCSSSGLPSSVAYSICRRRVSFAVQLGVCRQLLPLLPEISLA
jgi:hypothetical protein